MRACIYYRLSFLVYIATSRRTLTETAATDETRPAAANTGGMNMKLAKGCARGDLVCEKDRLSYDAIKALHEQLDDDKNGDVDLSESEEFLREELQYKADERLRTSNFHNNDTHVTVDDLWDMWIQSEVHNWTVEDVATWLLHHVELPQYAAVLKAHAVDGSSLPRIASNNHGFVSSILAIKNPVHRQKLCLKAMDTVLFGAPKVRHSLAKDLLLVTAITVAIGGIMLAHRQYKASQRNLRRWEADVANLQSLQERLQDEQIEKRFLSEGKVALEAKIQAEMNEAKAEAERLRMSRMHTETELSRLRLAEEELQKVREALADAEKQLELHRMGDGASAFTSPTAELQQWLQITYELEQRTYNQKKAAAEQELVLAKEACEKLRKRRSALFGTLRMAHSSTLDEFEYQIIHAKQALDDVKLDFAERQRRWQAIENLCGAQVETNPGLAALAAATGHKDLLHKISNGSVHAPLMSSEDTDELSDLPVGYAPVVARYEAQLTYARLGKMPRSCTPSSQLSNKGDEGYRSDCKSHSAEQEESASLAESISLYSGSSVSERPQFTLYEDSLRRSAARTLPTWSVSCEIPQYSRAGMSLHKSAPTMASHPALTVAEEKRAATMAIEEAAGSGSLLCNSSTKAQRCCGDNVDSSHESLDSIPEVSKHEQGISKEPQEKKKRSLLNSLKRDKPSALKNLAVKMMKDKASAK